MWYVFPSRYIPPPMLSSSLLLLSSPSSPFLFFSFRSVRTNRHSFKSHRWPNFLQFHGTPQKMSVSGHKKSLLGVRYSYDLQTQLRPSLMQTGQTQLVPPRGDAENNDHVVEVEDLPSWTDSEKWREVKRHKHQITHGTSNNSIGTTGTTGTSGAADIGLLSLSHALVLHYGSISCLRCDAVIVPAHPLLSPLLSSSPLTAVAGPELLAHMHTNDPLQPPQCIQTPGFNSNANTIIHCAVPTSPDLLFSCYRNALALSSSSSSVAVSLLCCPGSSSLYSAVHTCVRAVAEWAKRGGGGVKRIVFCVETDEVWKMFNRLIRVVFKTLK
eukprot:GHVS01018849.1.p1 GENE.GHVS01018849.1~~GHVS01018849.1.p1  ORF type:complete len:327 (-),score=71.94 GHVS01018849.1:305-1285(-)